MSLGFNLDKQLDRALNKYHETDLSHIEFDSDLTASTENINLAGQIELVIRMSRIWGIVMMKNL